MLNFDSSILKAKPPHKIWMSDITFIDKDHVGVIKGHDDPMVIPMTIVNVEV